MATAHKITRTMYHLSKMAEVYMAQVATARAWLRRHTRHAHKLGCTLTPTPAPYALPAA